MIILAWENAHLCASGTLHMGGTVHALLHPVYHKVLYTYWKQYCNTENSMRVCMRELSVRYCLELCQNAKLLYCMSIVLFSNFTHSNANYQTLHSDYGSIRDVHHKGARWSTCYLCKYHSIFNC